jgi:hypothetical protein
MTDLFDPMRHRVWAVDVTHSYRTYVVAETADDAEAAATGHADEDQDLAMETSSYLTQELTTSLPKADQTLPWGPARWGRRWLTVNDALSLIRSPRPAPPAIATDRLRHLDGWDWVRLAAATDTRRPVLRAVQVCGGMAVATDRHRLHIAPVTCPDGLWDAELMEPALGEYPPHEHLLDSDGPVMELVDLEGAWEVLRYARPGMVDLPCGRGRCTFDADQLAEALLGATPGGRVLLTAAAGDMAIRLDFPELRRTALLTRMVGRHPSADLSLFVRPLDPAAAVPSPIASKR